MPVKEVYSFSKFLPFKLKNWFINRIEIADDDIYSFLRENHIELSNEENELVLIAVALNMLQDMFVSSKISYENALKYFEQRDISKFRFGRNVHYLDSQFLAEWKEFVYSFEELKGTMDSLGLPKGRDISDLIANVKNRYDR